MLSRRLVCQLKSVSGDLVLDDPQAVAVVASLGPLLRVLYLFPVHSDFPRVGGLLTPVARLELIRETYKVLTGAVNLVELHVLFWCGAGSENTNAWLSALLSFAATMLPRLERVFIVAEHLFRATVELIDDVCFFRAHPAPPSMPQLRVTWNGMAWNDDGAFRKCRAAAAATGTGAGAGVASSAAAARALSDLCEHRFNGCWGRATFASRLPLYTVE